MEDIVAGRDFFAKDLRPKWTKWKSETITYLKTVEKRRRRRIYKHYLKTGDIRIFNRYQRIFDRWEFD